MLIDAKYYVATITSFCDVIGEEGIAFGYEGSFMRELAELLSTQSDNLILFGATDSRPSAAFHKGKEISIAYDEDGNEFYCLIDSKSISILEEKRDGGFYLIEQLLINPPFLQKQ